MSNVVLHRLSDWLDTNSWPLAGFLPENLENLILVDPQIDVGEGSATFGLLSPREIGAGIPGLNSVTFVISPAAGTSLVTAVVTEQPFSVRLHAVVVLRVDANILRPLKPGTREPDLTKEYLEISLGEVDLSIDAAGEVGFSSMTAGAVPECMVSTSGVILQVGAFTWLTPSTSSTTANVPADFTGMHFDDVTVEIVGLSLSTGRLRMDDVFIGTGGFSGTVSWTGPLCWEADPQEPNKNVFRGAITGELFGFAGGLSGVRVTFQQNTLTECEISGDVYVPYLEKRIGLTIGLDGVGGVTAAAGLPHSSPLENGVSTGNSGYLLHVEVGSATPPLLEIDIDSFLFTCGGEGTKLVTISGALDINIDGFDIPPLEFDALRIDANGDIAIDGGWLDMREAKSATFRGFPLEITRLGFGKYKSGCFWVGLNGGIKMADGLPIGASVEGLRICWHPGTSNFDVSLKGVGIEFRSPNTLEFSGTVTFFSEGVNHGFKGSVKLTIISINLTIDAQLVVGRSATGDTFFYLYLAVDLPTGIPLFSTGASIYGFAGLIATNMGPTRQEREHWYYGWYLRNPKGVTSVEKWQPHSGAFAGGVGTTIGTSSDDGYAFSAKLLLVLLLPGPSFLLTGKGKFLKKRADSQDVQQEGNFDALTILDFPGKLFQSNLAAAYTYKDLLTIEGGTDVAFSWAPSPPPDIWHVYHGEKAPPEKRIRARLLEVLRGSSYFQMTRRGIETGTWVGLKDRYRYGPVHAWFEASVAGDAAISWNPPSFVGTLQMVGSAGISAFGVTIRVSLNSSVTTRGPRPWYLHLRIELSIKIDLWFFEFSETVVLPLTWGNANNPLPDPIKPVLTLAAEHLKIDETFRLLTDNTENGPPSFEPEIPPDSRPVIIFQRPLADGAQIGAPSLPTPEADNVGIRTFAYELAHVMLIRRDGGQRVLCAAGKLNVSGVTATFLGSAGLALPGVKGATLELVGHGSYTVTAVGNGTVTLAGSPPSGNHAYRLQGYFVVANVQVSTIASAAHGTAVLNLSANHGRGYGAFAGGTLRQEPSRWTVVMDTGTSVTVRVTAGSPVAGPATLEAASGGLLEGQWLPVVNRETADDAAPTTKLMLWARTPFAWFRRNGSDAITGFRANNPKYPCGPPPVDNPVCLDFDDLQPGRLPAHFTTGRVMGTATGSIKVVCSGNNIANRFLRLVKPHETHTKLSVTFQFMGPVEKVEVRYRVMASTTAFVTGRRRGSIVTHKALPLDKNTVALVGVIDELSITGGEVLIDSICIRPGWTCPMFDKKAIPDGSTGRHQIGDLTVETMGTMVVKENILEVLPPPNRVAMVLPTDSLGRVHSKFGILPGASSDRVRHLLGDRATAPLGVMPRIKMRGIRADIPVYLPGLGASIVTPDRPEPIPPPRKVPNPGDWRWARPVPLPQRTLPSGKIGQLRTIDGGSDKPVASVAFLFPHPVTRLYIVLAGKASILGYKGTHEIVRKEVGTHEEVNIVTPPDFVDRILLLSPGSIKIVRLCYDDGNLGWQLAAQDGWQATLAHSIEWMYREDPILAPGNYRLEVVTQTTTGGAEPRTNWAKAGGNFKVGQPPGTQKSTTDAKLRDRYPYGGPLTELSTYVERTMPAAGQRPFYRSYDVGVIFNVPYCSRMFLAAGRQLQLVVVDSNDRERRSGAGTVWGKTSDLALSHEIADWIGIVNAGKSTDCPTIDVEQVSLRSETVYAGAGELLASNELHAGEVRTSRSGPPLYRFEFVTSRFANFKHHIARLDGRCRTRMATRPGVYDPLKLVAVRETVLELSARANEYLSAREAASRGSPTKEQLDSFRKAADTLASRFPTLARARSDAFDAIWDSYFAESPSATLPKNLEISRIIPANGSTATGLLLIESPEPLPWDRIFPRIGRSAGVPLRRRAIPIDRRKFGAPDAGSTFEYGGCRWTTDVELQVTAEGVLPRVPVPWTISIEFPGMTWLQLVVRVAPGGNALLHGHGTAVSADVTQGPTAPGSDGLLTISGTEITRVTLTGNGTTIVGLTIFERFYPQVPHEAVRLIHATLPGSTADNGHFVEMTCYSDVDVSDWTINWISSAAPGEPALYHRFSPGTVVKDAEVVRIYGSVSSPRAEVGLRVVGGGMIGTVPQDGAVLQLADTEGKIVHEIATLPDSAFTSGGALPESWAINTDGTRAFYIPVFGTVERGQWRLEMKMSRAGYWGRSDFSVGGDTSPEVAIVQFTAE